MPPRPNKITCSSKRLSEPRELDKSWKTTLNSSSLTFANYLAMRTKGSNLHYQRASQPISESYLSCSLTCQHCHDVQLCQTRLSSLNADDIGLSSLGQPRIREPASLHPLGTLHQVPSDGLLITAAHHQCWQKKCPSGIPAKWEYFV